MKRWPTKLLGDICVINPKLTVSEIPASNTQVTFVPMAAVDEISGSIARPELREYKQVAKGYTPFRENDVLFAKITPCMQNGKAAIARGLSDGRGFGSTEFHVLRPSEILLPQWVFAFIRQPSFRSAAESSFTGSAGQQRVPTDFLKRFPILVPPLAEQERIVKLLDEANELRKLRAQADGRNAALLPALFNEMFGRDCDWPVELLENLCKRVTVGHVGQMVTEYVENGVAFLRGQNIKRGRLDLTSVFFVSPDFHKRLEKSSIIPGDVVSVRTGKPGTTAVIPPSLKVANCADLIVMTCGEKLNPHFLCELLNQRLGDKDTIVGATGIAQQHFNIGEARRLKIALPPLSLQKEFALRVTEIRELEAAQAGSGQRLEALFQSMLHRAFNGGL
jgi:type I restriction enzyme S subunit